MTNPLIGIRIPPRLLAELEAERDRQGVGSIQAALIIVASAAFGIPAEIPRGSGFVSPESKPAKKKKSR